jgi:hypothetical protein
MYIDALYIYLLVHCTFFFSWKKGSTDSCEVLAFLENALSVYEIESLTLVCVERYVKAKYMAKGKILKNSFIVLLFILVYLVCYCEILNIIATI